MTRIEWVKNPDGTQGQSWNPITGCTKISPGCKNCYAERMARRLAGRAGYPEIPHHFDVTLRPDRLDIPLKRKKPTIYFVPSMGDLFHKNVPVGFIRRVFKTMAAADWHTFQVLTKRSERLSEFCRSPWYRNLRHIYGLNNVWLGVSIENPAYSFRSHYLREIPAAVRFISFEPLLISFADYPGVLDDVDWVIVGGESGPGARPMHPDWAKSIRNQCQVASVPFFFKQHGAWLHESQTTVQQRGEMHDKVKSLPSHKWPDNSYSWRVRKKYAGRLLDGREWNEMPIL